MERERLLSRDFALAFVASMFAGISFFLFVHFPGFLDDLGATETVIGLVSSAAAVAAVAARPWLGAAVDRGRRPVLLVFGLLNVGVVLLYLTIASIGPWLYVIRIAHGISQGALFTGIMTLGADVVPASRRTEGLAIFGVSGLLPIALGGVIGDFILSRYDFTALFVTSATFSFLVLVIAFVIHEEKRPVQVSRPSFLAAISQRSLLPLWLIVGAMAFVLTGYFTFLRTFVDETGIGSVGLFFAFYAATAILVRLLFARLPDRVGAHRAVAGALTALAGGLIVLAMASTSVDVAISGTLCGVGHGLAFPILFGLVVTRAPDQVRGSAVAFFTALFDIGVLVGAPILGVVIELSGYPAMFVFSALALLVALVVFMAWDRQYSVVPPAVVAT